MPTSSSLLVGATSLKPTPRRCSAAWLTLAGCLPAVLLLLASVPVSMASPLVNGLFTGYPMSGVSAITFGDLDGDHLPEIVFRGGSGVNVWHNAGAGDFTPLPNVFGGGSSVALGDVDRDGRLDLVTPAGAAVLVQLGNGDGTFGLNTTIPYPWGPTRVALADMTGDGILDLVTCSGSAIVGVSIRRGLGDGTFSAFKTDFATPSAPGVLIVTDLSGDGRPDVLVSGPADSSVSVFRGTASGTLGPRADLRIPGGAADLTTGDVTGDGRLDLAVATARSEARILPNDGTGGFTLGATVPLSRPARFVVLADAGDDGAADLVALFEATSSAIQLASLEIHAGAGGSSFGPADAWPIAPYLYCAAAADLDADGRTDLVLGHNAGGADPSSTMSIMLGRRGGGFGHPPRARVGAHPISFDVGDLNGDTRPDVVTVNAIALTLSSLLGQGDGSFGARRDIALDGPPARIGLVDVNRDGKLDAVFTQAGTTPALVVRLGLGDGSFDSAHAYPVGSNPLEFAVGDVNRDSLPDAVVACEGASRVALLYGTGGGAFAPYASVTTRANPRGVALGDLDHDGWLDMIVVTAGQVEGDDAMTEWLGDRAGGFTPGVSFPYYPHFGQSPTSVVMAHVDSDEWLDVIGFTSGLLRVWLGDGTGNLTPRPTVAILSGFYASEVVRDLDGDGRLDCALPTAGGNSVSVARGLGDGSFAAPLYHGAGWNIVGVRAARVDAGPSLDLVCLARDSSEIVTLLGSEGLLDADEPVEPFAARVLSAWPNPTRGAVALGWSQVANGMAAVRIRDVQGRTVRRLFAGTLGVGSQSLHWDLRDDDGRTVAPGLYLAEVRTTREAFARRVVVFR